MAINYENQEIVHVIDTNSTRREETERQLAGGQLPSLGHASLEQLVRNYDARRAGCLLLELSGPGLDGMDVQQRLAVFGIDVPVIVLASQPTVWQAVAAMRAGAFDFVERPMAASRLIDAVREAIRFDLQTRDENRRRESIMRRVRSLTSRERQTLGLVLEGMSTKQIASRFGIGLQTAAKHRARLLNKMEVRSDAQLVRLCMSHKVDVGPPESSALLATAGAHGPRANQFRSGDLVRRWNHRLA